MRSDYPVSSQRFNDQILLAYENLVHLLGYEDESNRYSGLYEILQASGNAYMTNSSGIPHIGNTDDGFQLGLSAEDTSDQVILYLKWDYVWRKYLGLMQRTK